MCVNSSDLQWKPHPPTSSGLLSSLHEPAYSPPICSCPSPYPPPSHFNRLSFPPLQRFPLGWEGQQLCKNLLPWAVSFRQRRLARSQDGKRLTTAKSTEHVNSFYSYPSLGNQKAKDTLVISLVLWTSTPPRPATHFWFLCSQCPGICGVGNRNREPIAPQLLPIKMCNWISHACFKHHSRRDLQATV